MAVAWIFCGGTDVVVFVVVDQRNALFESGSIHDSFYSWTCTIFMAVFYILRFRHILWVEESEIAQASSARQHYHFGWNRGIVLFDLHAF